MAILVVDLARFRLGECLVGVCYLDKLLVCGVITTGIRVNWANKRNVVWEGGGEWALTGFYRDGTSCSVCDMLS